MLSSAVVGTLLPFPHFNPNPNPNSKHNNLVQPQKPNNCSSILCSSTHDSSTTTSTPVPTSTPPLIRKRMRYRKLYPGESEGIVEEMRFVAMNLHNKKTTSSDSDTESGFGSGSEEEPNEESFSSSSLDDGDGPDGNGETWQPSMEGFLKYLVDSRHVFQTLERIVDKSDDVSYAYFRKTGLERSERLSNDLEWFLQQDMAIPETSSPGISYARYLEELAEKSAPLFLCHFYNIYFAHISGGQVIAKKVSETLLGGWELEFCSWEGDALELLKDVREKLNMLGEHWTRDEKNKCLRETTKSFRYLGQIVRLIIIL